MTPMSLVKNPGGVYSMPQGMGQIKMTPRSLVQNPGRVYSMPQATGLKFLEIRRTSSDVDGFSFLTR